MFAVCAVGLAQYVEAVAPSSTTESGTPKANHPATPSTDVDELNWSCKSESACVPRSRV